MNMLPWSFLCAASIVALGKWFHPATFSAGVFSLLVFAAVISSAVAIVHKRYE